MGLPKQLKNIYLTQLRAIRERLERIEQDAGSEADDRYTERRMRRDAEAELYDLGPTRSGMRTPEEIAAGTARQTSAPTRAPLAQAAQPAAAGSAQPASTESPLDRHYRVLELEAGADFAAVQAKYARVCAICDPKNWPEGTDDRKTAEEIRVRVDTAYYALRDALDSTAGRFDKLELE